MNKHYLFIQLTQLEEKIKNIHTYIVKGIQDDPSKPVSFLYNYGVKIEELYKNIHGAWGLPTELV